MLHRLAERKGTVLPAAVDLTPIDAAIDQLAESVNEHLDMKAIFAMAGLNQDGPS
jgi:hypothetical protein